MKRLKICLLLTRPEPHRIPMLSLIAETVAADFEILYCTRATYQQHDLQEEKECKMPYRYLSGSEWITNPENQSSWLWNSSITGELERANPNLILLAGYSNMTMLYALGYARLHKIPYGIFNESHLLKRRNQWKAILKRLFLPFIVKNASACLTPGAKAREYLEYYGARPERIFNFPNTCDIDFFEKESGQIKKIKKQMRTSFGLNPDGTLFIYVGRLIECKNLSVLIQAARAVKDSGEQFQLLIVGDGPLRGTLEREVKAQELSEVVVFKGFSQNRDLAPLYGISDVLTLPSSEETWGVVVNEAAACGLALLLSDQVGAGYDLLKEGKNGFAFGSHDVHALSEKMKLFCSHPLLSESFGAASKEMVKRFSYQAGVESFKTMVSKFDAGN